MQSRNFRLLLVLAGCIAISLLFGYHQNANRLELLEPGSLSELADAQRAHSPATTDQTSVDLVVASTSKDDTKWLDSLGGNLTDWRKLVYVVDNPSSYPRVPANKGRESMPYLTYIIDHYDELAEVVIFHHSNRYQWHNDHATQDSARVLSKLRLPYVLERGYANLRCVWSPGCPSEIRPHADAAALEPSSRNAGAFYKQVFEELFPTVPVPETVGVACCAQFAVTAERIRSRAKSDYERYRQWLLQTDLNDHVSGTVLEYMWHIILGEEAVSCPNAGDCYCKLLGHCDMTCESPGSCVG